MARAAWSGAITFAGFPINVRVFNLVKSRSAESFKTLAPNGQPIKQVYVDSDGVPVDRAECGKGVEVGKDTYKVLPPESIEAIQSAERSVAIEPLRFCALESVPLHLAIGQFRVVPDEKVPGADQPTSILWNGLKATNRALITTLTMRAGSRDMLFVIHADEYGLNANSIPFKAEMQDVPEWKPVEDEQAAGMFSQVVDNSYDVLDFTHGSFESTYTERRAEAVQAALKGEAVIAPAKEKAQAAAPDLMAAMAATLGETKKAGKQTAKKKAPVTA